MLLHLHLQCEPSRGPVGASQMPLFNNQTFSQRADGKKQELQEWPSWLLLAQSPGLPFPLTQFSFKVVS